MEELLRLVISNCKWGESAAEGQGEMGWRLAAAGSRGVCISGDWLANSPDSA
jgi:hypothetical protein